MRKAIVLNNRKLTPKKEQILRSFTSEYLQALRMTLPTVPFANNQTNLHEETYSRIRNKTSLPSDIVQESRKDAWKLGTHMEQSGYNGVFNFKSCSIRLNQRWFRYVKTKRGNPCFKITYSPKKTFTIPIELDKQFERFKSFTDDGWEFRNISLLMNGRIAVVLEKEFEKVEPKGRYVIGVDVGSSTLAAVSILDTKTGRVLKQLYLGRDVAKRQKRYSQRRAFLQELADNGSERARKSLRKLKHKQSNFVKTRSGQIAKEIVNLAQKHNAYISTEKLKNIRAVRGSMNKKARKKINRIPYTRFKEFLISNCEMFQVHLHEVDAYHTSKWCVNCGAVNAGHVKSNYALYRCKKCGLIVNSDRKASLAIAMKSVLERSSHSLTAMSSFQFSKTPGSVNALLRPDAVGNRVAV